jgi:ATP-dependent Clp protease protease subunit
MNSLIVEETDHGESVQNVFTKLASSRIIFLSNVITDSVASDIVATLLYLDSVSQDKISIYINSEGGELRNIFMIYDIMHLLKSPIETVCIGSAHYESALLLASGTKGMRYATKNATICLSNYLVGEPSYSDLTDASITLEKSKKDNKSLMLALGKATGQTLAKITKDCEKKMYLNSLGAKKYGVIDYVIS